MKNTTSLALATVAASANKAFENMKLLNDDMGGGARSTTRGFNTLSQAGRRKRERHLRARGYTRNAKGRVVKAKRRGR